MELLTKFWSLLSNYGNALNLIAIVISVIALSRSLSKSVPILYRLGKALSSHEILIYADDRYEDLKETLEDSGLFDPKKIKKVGINNLDKIRSADICIVHYQCAKNSIIKENDRLNLQEHQRDNTISRIINLKSNNNSLIVYAPHGERLQNEEFGLLDSKNNTALTNFRGRLVSDVLISMIAMKRQKALF
ncbi:hypothetical protein [Marinomonas mediterranea]|jgi:hypothetical protein|uniref:Uncharacterized protein n=1 Tax=Marinomonas mediterranea (strain ATCC 700492 / JCM 21426 / NBRC 103028 / MMB-1) TaxID=717774 RepID=F2K1W1_MARM1|nr:hypothetical protein [Marinomonas mediterranea]ADZ89955.1 hypothetical protein Marme_0671 [Marinomonas mediterranea MMB-1]WCN16165.1 hypothetical protein GV053_03360 [Marinomonas mediterranea MMB-1]